MALAHSVKKLFGSLRILVDTLYTKGSEPGIPGLQNIVENHCYEKMENFKDILHLINFRSPLTTTKTFLYEKYIYCHQMKV